MGMSVTMTTAMATTLVTGHDRTTELVMTAQHSRSSRDLAAGEGPADGGRGDRLDPSVRSGQQLDPLGHEAEAGAGRAQRVDVARPICAEVEVSADDHGLGGNYLAAAEPDASDLVAVAIVDQRLDRNAGAQIDSVIAVLFFVEG